MYMPTDIDNLMQKPSDDQMLTIVGIIAPMRFRGLVDSSGNKRVGAYFFPFQQSPSRSLGFAIRTAQPPEDGAQRRCVARWCRLIPELPFYGVRTMEDSLSAR